MINKKNLIFILRFKKFGRFNEKDAKIFISSAKKFIKDYITKHKIFEIESNTAETPTPVPAKKGIDMFDFNVDDDSVNDSSRTLTNNGKLAR